MTTYDVKLTPEQAPEVGQLLLNDLGRHTVILTQQGDGGVVLAFTADNGATNVATYEVSAAGTVTDG
jgi:hypothetical protein